jgi:hypothetical protein
MISPRIKEKNLVVNDYPVQGRIEKGPLSICFGNLAVFVKQQKTPGFALPACAGFAFSGVFTGYVYYIGITQLFNGNKSVISR